MANELTINLTANLANGQHKESFQPAQLSVDQAAVGAHAPVVQVPAADTALSVGDINTLGWLFIENLDPSNYVTYGPDSAAAIVPFGRIEPGEFAALRLEPGITFRWQANTAPVKVKVLLLED